MFCQEKKAAENASCYLSDETCIFFFFYSEKWVVRTRRWTRYWSEKLCCNALELNVISYFHCKTLQAFILFKQRIVPFSSWTQWKYAIAQNTKQTSVVTTHGIHILDVEVEVAVASDVSFRFNPITVMSHFGIDSRLVFFCTAYSPTYYSNNIPNISVMRNNQWSSRITLKKKKIYNLYKTGAFIMCEYNRNFNGAQREEQWYSPVINMDSILMSVFS